MRKGIPALGLAALVLVGYQQQGQMRYTKLESQELRLELAQQLAHNARLRRDHQERWQGVTDQLRQSRLCIEQIRSQMRPLQLLRRASLASRSGRLSPIRHFDLELQQQRQQLDELRYQAEQRALALPLGPPCKGPMTSPFGPRLHPIYGVGRPHLGCDFTVPHGTPIRATADGKVIRADWLGGYGQVVEVEHPFGLKTLFAHCSLVKVRKGQEVKRGDWLANVGSSGLASGPHCHYEIHLAGEPIDPAPFLKWKP